jgi:hypothetical protein
MQRTKGQSDFPLSYILRENNGGTHLVPEDFDTIDAYEKAIVPFSGPHYEIDNNSVFDALKSYILGGPHWTWKQDFDKTRDGRGAWRKLKEHFDGPSNQIRLKAAAYVAIRRAEYKGAKNFDYALYCHIHTQALSDLARYGELAPKTKKVKNFLDGIMEALLQPIKYTLAGFTNLMENFHEVANYIGNIIDLNKKNEFPHVSSFNSGRGRGRGGRGQGHGRESGRNPHGGRGRGRGFDQRGGRYNQGGCNANNPGFWISSEDWQNMTEEEKESLQNARANYAKHNISALNGADAEDEDDPPTKPQHQQRLQMQGTI